PVTGQPVVVPTVVLLFTSGRPPTVLRRVGAVVVEAVNRVLGTRSRPHVGQKRRVVMPPAVADRNPTSSIPRITAMRRLDTPQDHLMPHRIFRRLSVMARGPMRHDR